MMSLPRDTDILIAGAGPAGLAAAYELSSHGRKCHVIDRNAKVGGLCRTYEHEGNLFDIGGHRFLSRSPEVNAIWKAVLGDDLIRRERKSRIFFEDRFYDYPLKPLKAFRQLGWARSASCGLSYLGAQIGNGGEATSFESWMKKRFGGRLYRIFFEEYTRKVWGISGSEISSDWADQRIQQLSLSGAVKAAWTKKRKAKVKSLSETFFYPRRGPGQFCDALRGMCEEKDSRFHLNTALRGIQVSGDTVKSVDLQNECGKRVNVRLKSLLSSIPLPLMVRMISPQVPERVLEAANTLRFRNFISVNLLYDTESLFEDHWIYLHSSKIRAGRIQNYKNWSPDMVRDPGTTSLGVEYFVSREDDLWEMSEGELIQFAVDEIGKTPLAPSADFLKGCVIKVPNAYPVYNHEYKKSVNLIRDFLSRYKNLQLMGRAGLFRYNNSDHAILTGLFAARNILGERHDVWSVDPDAEWVDV